nr:hypothetical protein [Mesorhizobium loti]
MADTPQPRDERLQRYEQRIRIGLHLDRQMHLTMFVDDAHRRLVHRNIQSAKIFHQLPPAWFDR